MSSWRNFGGYELVAGIGEGRMARVYLGMVRGAEGFTKLMALKILRSNGASANVGTFHSEGKLAARLNHPNVVQTYEAGEADGCHYIAMEYLEGLSLGALVAQFGFARIPLPVSLRILCDTLDGLHYAHEFADYDGRPLGLVHRDVCPDNVMVTYAGRSKLLDFGLARSTASGSPRGGLLRGTTGTMAPEQVNGGPLSRRADIFAVGVMLWEALAKRRLVRATDDEVAALLRRAAGRDTPVREAAPSAPEELLAICEKAMAADPKRRFATAAEMRDALEAYLARTGPCDARRVAAFLTPLVTAERTRVRRLVDALLKADAASPIVDLSTEAATTPPTGLAPRARLVKRAPPPPPSRKPRRLAALGALLGLVAGGAFTVAIVARPARIAGAETRHAPVGLRAEVPTSPPVGVPPSIELPGDTEVAPTVAHDDAVPLAVGTPRAD